MRIYDNYSLKKHNTFGVDAKADFFVTIKNVRELREFADTSLFKKNKVLVIGGGSNLLFTRDFLGGILYVDIRGINILESREEYVLLEAGAGESWHNLVTISVNNKFHGLENLALIPGNVGAAPVQNIGAYGVEQKDVFHSLIGVDLRDGKIKKLSAEDCEFSYRSSVFKNELKDQFIVTNVIYKLSRMPLLQVAYKDIQQELQKFGIADPDQKYIFDTVCRIRTRKLPDPDMLGNAGSFFKNPCISKYHYEQLKSDYPNIPAYDCFDDSYKVPAAWLIENCGWKGKKIGDAGVYDNHALIIVNYGQATGEQILELAELITQSVDQKFGIKLEKEVQVL